MRLAVLGPSHNPVVQPYAGGQERFTADLVRGMRQRGHRVELFARVGTDPDLADVLHVMPEMPRLSDIASSDPNMPEPDFLHDQSFYLAAMRDLLRRKDVDAILNESLHQLPLALSPLLEIPVLTTLHTPPFPWLEIGAWLAGDTGHYVAVSEATRRQWATVTTSEVIHNGVDPDRFAFGVGGSGLAWAGRMTPEKGADLAVHAAVRAGRSLRLAGPISNPDWFDGVIRPLLSASVTYEGALAGAKLSDFYGTSAATLVTPRWEEPFCLVAAESQMCGTPVVGLRRGGLTEVVRHPGGLLVAPEADAVQRLAEAVDAVSSTNREAIAADARDRLSLERMIERYEALLCDLCESGRRLREPAVA